MGLHNVNCSHNPSHFVAFTTQVGAKHTVTEVTGYQHHQSKNKPFLFVCYLTCAASEYYHSAIQKVWKLKKK